ncbi:MAG: methionyl-tRNA formyltransferase [Firmicutes bacterium]|nr:methionyl-tRNA formyltransferase [[Eubacterium] siraeum]MCM1488938.1 methionyl-tRNA formyltransferase [Bacillota bacterium]
MNTVFMGTPEFSVPCLRALIEAGHNVDAVFTQPDKPKNRGHKLQMTPVKEFALEKGIRVFQPLSLRKGEDGEKALQILQDIKPDCIVVTAYGQILPKAVLELPKYGCINVHASLLPRYRGAAPIQRCIMEGEKVTGITTMFMGEGLDTGDMILKEELPIDGDMTASLLHDRLSEIGARLMVKTLELLEKGNAPRTPQTDENTCYAAMIKKDDCMIDFSRPAEKVYDQIRGLADSPCAFTFLEGKRLKVYFSEIIDGKTAAPSGTVVEGKGLCVSCGGKILRLTEIQPEGGKRMKDSDFLRGRKTEPGTVFGS